MLNKNKKRSWLVLLALVALIFGLVACGGSDTEEPAGDDTAAEDTAVEEPAAEEPAVEEPVAAGLESDAAEVKSEFFSQEQYDRSMRQMTLTAEGPEGEPWLQYLEAEFVDTSAYAKDGPYTLCFSNAGVNNPWRVVGYNTMLAYVDLHPEIEEQWAWFVIMLSLLGIFYGALLAFMQINFRRLLAFAIISQTGLITIGLFDFSIHGMEGGITLAIAFGMATAGILLSLGMIYKRTHTAFIPRLGGMFDTNAAIAVLFVICALSTMGMPGTPSFDGIHLLIDGTIQGQGWLIAIAILFGNVLTVGLLLRAFQQIFIANPKRFQGPYVNTHHASSQPSPRNEWIITIAICGLLIVTGANTSPWLHIIDQSISATSSNDSHSSTETLHPDKLLATQYIISKDN